MWVGIAIVERFSHHGHEDSMHDRHLDKDGDEKYRENLCHSDKVGRVEVERNQTEKCSGEESQQRPRQVEPDAIVERAEEGLLKVTNSLKRPFFFLCFLKFFVLLRHGNQSWRVFRSAVGRANRPPPDRAARVGRGSRPLGCCGADWRTGLLRRLGPPHALAILEAGCVGRLALAEWGHRQPESRLDSGSLERLRFAAWRAAMFRLGPQ